MFKHNRKGQTDTMQSLIQSCGDENKMEKKKHHQEVDDNVSTFSQIHNNEENGSYHSFVVEQLDENGHLSEEMQKVKEAEIRELKLREQVSRDSPEMMELNNKLHQAAFRKDMDLQLQEKANKKQEDKIHDQFYRDQLNSANQRHILEDQEQEKLAAQRKADYRRDLEAQMAANAEKKKEEKYRSFLKEQQVTRGEMERMDQEDKRSQAEKMNKTQMMREDMEAALKTREQARQKQKNKNQELEKNVVTYWEDTSRVDTGVKQDHQDRQECITHRQEQCAQNLQDINDRNQTRSDLIDNIALMSHHISQDSHEIQQDLDEVDRKLKQTELCSELDGQVADKARDKRSARRVTDAFHETWMWGGDAASEKGEHDEKLRRQKEVADYNQATVRQHEKQKMKDRHCNVEPEAETNTEEVFKQRLIEEEKERLLEAEEAIDE